jgi:hypothetical protein
MALARAVLRYMVNPDEVPSSSMAGGCSTMMAPSGACSMACCASATSSPAVAPLRWSQSLSVVKAMAALGPDPAKLKPSTEMLEAMPGRDATCSS